ncbi:hypothetical protein, partial [Mesorhizobium sp. M1365]|uniref:hypothetical protein n=1 Tax=Mesorhizobium sp. M1365 TaxID=2957090 RepID=UPI0033378D4D
AHRLRPAGSCIRDFRTPDGTRNPSAMSAIEANFASARKQTLQLTALKVVIASEPAKAQLGTRGRTFRRGNNLKKRFATHSMPRHGEI